MSIAATDSRTDCYATFVIFSCIKLTDWLDNCDAREDVTNNILTQNAH